MRLIDEQYTKTPFYGVPRLAAWLRRQGHVINRKRVARLMTKMGLAAIYPKSKPSAIANPSKTYPYLLKGLRITRPNQVCGYHLYPLDRWVCVFRSRYGLVFPLSVVMGTFKLTRCILLSIST